MADLTVSMNRQQAYNLHVTLNWWKGFNEGPSNVDLVLSLSLHGKNIRNDKNILSHILSTVVLS